MEYPQLAVPALLDLSHTAARPLLEGVEYPWQVLLGIGEFIKTLGSTLSPEEYEHPEEWVWVHKTAKRFPNNYIAGPCLIGPETEIRPGAFIRGNALVGAGCVVGNSTELKNVILFDSVQVPHYNYVGDSILGYKAHMGAGAVTSNVKSDKSLVTIAMGCGTVLNPGTVIGRGSRIYPLSSVRGVVAGNSIYKRAGEIAPIR